MQTNNPYTLNPNDMKVLHFRPKGAILAALLTLLLFAAGMTKLQAQNITFDDPNVKALCVDPETEWDTNHDGELSYEEAAAVTNLGTVFSSNSVITSFDELQYFTGLTSIGGYAFFNCSGLTSVVFPGSIATIGYFAFMGCNNLTSLELPSTLTFIDDYGFAFCNNLASITVWATTPPNLNLEEGQAGVFANVNTSISVYVPCEALNAYQSYVYGNNPGWGGFSNFIGMGGTCPISFADANVKDICATQWGSNGELTNVQAAAVTDLGTVFMNNSVITSFDELQYFTGLTFLGSSVFHGCQNLVSVRIPKAVTAIGTGAFSGCSSLASMSVVSDNQIYDSRNGCNAIIETASNTLVAGCITTVIPDDIVSIGGYAFYGLPGLTSVVFPNLITSIEEGAYAGCTSLESLTVHATTPPVLGTDAFDGVNVSIPVYIPAGTLAAYQAAEGWNNFTNFVEVGNIIDFADDNVKTICVDNWDTNGDGELSYEEAAAVTSLKRPNINQSVFKGNRDITSFDELQYFTGLTSIMDYAFEHCENLTSIKIPNTKRVIPIGNYAFEGCINLTSIEIPSLVISIGRSAFAYCNRLASLTVWATTPPDLEEGNEGVFANVNTSIPVYVPCEGLNAYQSYVYNGNPGWGGFQDFIGTGGTCPIEFADEVVKAICVATETCWDINCDGELSYDEAAAVTDLGRVFKESLYNTNITSFDELQYFSGLTSIGDSAFRFCKSLTSVKIPASVTTIGKRAFQYCYSLSSIDIPNSVTTIKENAFEDCYYLHSIAIPNSVISIETNPFVGCYGLTSMVVAPYNSKYDSRNGCNAIISRGTNTLVAGCITTEIPNTVTSIGDSAFCRLTNLTSVVLPSSLTSIGKGAYSKCFHLESITVHATVPPTWGTDAFEDVDVSIPVYVPACTLADYQAAPGWSDFFTNFVEFTNETSQLSVTGYGDGIGGWNLIASPLVTDVAPADVDNMLNDVYDLYRFDGSCEGAEWRNFKNSANNGFTRLRHGQGYLYANSEDVTLQFVGPISMADSYTVDLTSSPAKLGKWNLIGNSFTDAATVSVSDYYRIEDSDRSVIVPSSGQVNAMEGIFVEYSEMLTEVTFTKANRGARAFGSPMVNIDLRDAEGRLLDRARLRTGEGASMGKLDLMSDPNRLYFRLDDEDYAMVRVNGEGEMPLNFDAAHDGSFTLSVKVEGMDMGYLHLVDNMTGADLDLLATSTGSESTYTFTAKTTDYASRFRLVFSEDGGSSTGSAATNFAYISNGNIVITNAGANAMLQVIDVMGRVIVSVGGHTRCITTSGIPAGVYVLRLVSGNDVKTQKIIIG